MQSDADAADPPIRQPPSQLIIHHLSPFHLDVALFFMRLAVHILQQIAPLEVLVGVHDGLKLRCRHNAFVLGPFDLGFVKMFKHTLKFPRFKLADDADQEF